MNWTRAFALTAVVAGCGGASSPAAVDGAPSAVIDATPPPDAAAGFDPLQGIGTVELIQEGFMFLEGPTWRVDDGVLLFSDIPANTIYRLTPPDAVDVFRPDSGNSNGLDSDSAGLLLAAEHGNRRVSRTMANGTVVDVATTYQTKRLNSPNDIAVRSDGTIYFTDPPYGISAPERELAFNGVFRVAPGGTVTAEWEGAVTTRPNGVVLSPAETTLYVADTEGDVLAWDVAPDGSLSNQRPFATDATNGDGLAVDTGGNVFVSAADGIRVYAPSGSLWGVITVKVGTVTRVPANCAFGDPDRRSLFITARQGLYRVRLANPGLY